jgi:hypothetical protein
MGVLRSRRKSSIVVKREQTLFPLVRSDPHSAGLKEVGADKWLPIDSLSICE